MNERLKDEIVMRTRAEEESREAHEKLKTRVKERTTELLSVNEQLRDQVAERKRVEEELEEAKRDCGFKSTACPSVVSYLTLTFASLHGIRQPKGFLVLPRRKHRGGIPMT